MIPLKRHAVIAVVTANQEAVISVWQPGKTGPFCRIMAVCEPPSGSHDSPERRAFANTTGKEVTMPSSGSMDEIRITAPVPGTCPVCATKHDERDPHDRNSLYYQIRFYRRYGRFPTWIDATQKSTREVYHDESGLD